MNQLDPKAVWLFFAQSFIGFGIILLFFIFMLGFRGFFTLEGFLTLSFSATPFLLLAPFTYLWAKLSYRYYRYELTEDGFKKEHGIIWKHYVTIPYDRIQNVDILRGVLARILGLSDLHIQTAGMSGIAMAEGRLPGLSQKDAEALRDELIKRAKRPTPQGL